MEEKFNFSPEKILNKTILFDVSKINEEKIIDKIIENLPADNDKLYIAHEQGSNPFFLNVKMENKPKVLQEAKNTFENLKAGTKSVLFSEEKLNMRLLKKLKNHLILKTSYC